MGSLHEHRESLQDLDILLVEDDPADIRMTEMAAAEALDRSHMNVVRDGVEALDYLYRRGKHADATRPDLILLDLNMPRKSGFEVLQVIKNDEGLRSIPVIILTTSMSEEDIVKAYAYHANSYVVKPRTLKKWAETLLGIQNHWMGVALLPKQDR